MITLTSLCGGCGNLRSNSLPSGQGVQTQEEQTTTPLLSHHTKEGMELLAMT
jgi:hypothetical protein